MLLLAAAAWLLIEPLLHWFVRWQLSPLREIAGWGVLAALVASSMHAVQERRAGWSACTAALAVALNPAFPPALPHRFAASLSIGAGVTLAVYALRRWK